jgi:hypothetical protein
MASVTLDFPHSSLNKEQVLSWQDAPDIQNDMFDQFFEYRGNADPSAYAIATGRPCNENDGIDAPISFCSESLGEGGGHFSKHGCFHSNANSSPRPKHEILATEYYQPMATHRLATGTPKQRNHVKDHDALNSGYSRGSGLITDVELLRLEGISLRSPRTDIATFNTSPPAPHATNAINAKRSNRILEAISSTVRRAIVGGRLNMKGAKDETSSGEQLPESHSSMGLLSPKREPGLNLHTHYSNGQDSTKVPPISPPKSGILFDIPPERATPFVTGIIEDPFKSTNSSPLESGGLYLQDGPITPMMTPVGYGNTNNHLPCASDLGQDAATISSTMAAQISTASWPLQVSIGISHDAATAQWTATVIPNEASGDWWEQPIYVNGYDKSQDGVDAHYVAQTNMTDEGILRSNYHHSQYDYDAMPLAPAAELSGLMIRMPELRTPSSVLVPEVDSGRISNYPPPPPTPTQIHPHTERRPRPRAPSAGARHRDRSVPLRRTRSSIRGESPSPALTGGGGGVSGTGSRHSSGGSQSGGRSASGTHSHSHSHSNSCASIRKRRSWTRREPRTPTSGSGDIGFVNYTPDDYNILLAGVAPSGSSRTKERREKEALERRRKLSEAAIRAVLEAGGDVARLLEEEDLVLPL